MAVPVTLDIPPHFAQLYAWGRGDGGWWALVVWNEHVGYEDRRYTGTQACAGWVAAGHVAPGAELVDTGGIRRMTLPADPAGWPRPVSRPGAYLPADLWWVGVLGGGEPGLPPGVRRL